LRELIENWSMTESLVAGMCAAALIVVIVLWWWIAGASPRRRRMVRAARKMLAQGRTSEVIALCPAIRAVGRPNAATRKEVDHIEGAALKAAAAERMDAKDYDAALPLALQAAHLLEENTLEPRLDVQNAILEDARQRLSGSAWGDAAPILELLERARRVQTPCKEASFWEAICYLREGNVDQAVHHLHIARTGMERSVRDEQMQDESTVPPSPILEPPLYLGALLLRQGKSKEAMRYFTEANRIDPSCALVTLHLGCAMANAGGDLSLTIRTLQRSLGPKGLGAWKERPAEFWAEVYPEGRSYVRKLAAKYPFHCPLWGETPLVLLRQGQLALGLAMQRQGNHQEAAELFWVVLTEGSPSLPVLRGLGLAQAKLGRFDDAYKPLRQAYDLENVKDQWTSGYLALCAAKAAPATIHDRPSNLAWAVKTVTSFNDPGDADWIPIISEVFDEARQANVPLSADDQLYLCEHLTSLHAIDAKAAAAFERMFAEHPNLARPEYAWLYAQSIASRGAIDEASLRLLEAALADRDAVRAYFDQQGWDLTAVERVLLLRAARERPGQVPSVLGDDGVARAERLLLDESMAAEQRGDLDEARQLVDALSRLVPHHPGALDRLAALHFRAGRTAQAVAALNHWQQRATNDPLPFVRLGLVRASLGDIGEALEHLESARLRAVGPARAQIALLAARLAMSFWGRAMPTAAEADAALLPQQGNSSHLTREAALGRAREFVHRALDDDPLSEEARALAAGLCWVQNDEAGLRTIAERCRDFTGSDPRNHYFAALALSSIGDWAGVVAACRKVTHLVADKNGTLGTLAIEAAYLEGVAQSELGDSAAAAEALLKPASADASASAPFAQGLLGAMLMQQGRFDDASTWWQKLPAPRRSEWKIGDVLGGAQMLAALEAFQTGRFDVAADKFRQAGKLGCRDRRLGNFLLASLVKAGKQAVYGAG
jgi:tetratricopeptide (TPR) repeat protein